MSPVPRKIVFNVPSLLPEEAARRRPAPAEPPPVAFRPAAAAAEPGDRPGFAEESGDVRKLATLLEAGQALAGTFNLQAGLHGLLEVLERRCGAGRGAVTLIEEASGLLVVEAALGYPRRQGRIR